MVFYRKKFLKLVLIMFVTVFCLNNIFFVPLGLFISSYKQIIYPTLTLLFIPTLVFFISKKADIMSSKPLILFAAGYLIGVIYIMFIAIYDVFDLGELDELIKPRSYNIILLLIISIVILGSVMNFIVSDDKVKNRIYYLIIAVSFSLLLISPFKGFYLESVVRRGNPFPLSVMSIQAGIVYNFKYLLYYIAYPLGVFAKYRLFEW